MDRVSGEHITNYGNYPDRADSYDDSSDLNAFANLVNTIPELKRFIMNYFRPPSYADCLWSYHPDGKKGIDLSITGPGTVNAIRYLNLDVERWSKWDKDWPYYYRYIHFLERKGRYLNQQIPFLMCYMNYSRDKVLIVDNKTIQRYTPKWKTFFKKQLSDKVREIRMEDGNLFGKRITDRERDLFNVRQDY
jgi:hypothetical protein